jgi:hypothetical protein
MKRSKLVRIGILAMTFAAAGLGASTEAAHAGVITLDVSATMSPGGFPASCSPACILGGDIVINNTTGAVVSENVTATGFSPSVGPFTNNQGIGNAFPLTVINIDDSRRDTLQLVVATPTAGSLVGYTGGPLDPTTVLLVIPGFWNLTSGSLTQPTAAPEPSSLLLLVMALAGLYGLFAVRWWKKRTACCQT